MSRDLLTTSTCEEREQLAECLTPQSKKLNHTEQSDPSKGCNANCRSCLLVPISVNTYQSCILALALLI